MQNPKAEPILWATVIIRDRAGIGQFAHENETIESPTIWFAFNCGKSCRSRRCYISGCCFRRWQARCSRPKPKFNISPAPGRMIPSNGISTARLDKIPTSGARSTYLQTGSSKGSGFTATVRDANRSGWPAVQGRYKRTFTPPAQWSNLKVNLVFEGVMTDTQASVNGQSIGPKHQGGYYQFKYDVTEFLKFGQDNLLEVTVDDESENSSVNKAERRGDYWNYGGIFRPIYLEAVPMDSIRRRGD